MNDLDLSALVMGLVAAVRAKNPRIDGYWVYLAVVLASLVVCAANYQGNQVKDFLIKAARVSIQSIAGTSGISYLLSKNNANGG